MTIEPLAGDFISSNKNAKQTYWWYKIIADAKSGSIMEEFLPLLSPVGLFQELELLGKSLSIFYYAWRSSSMGIVTTLTWSGVKLSSRALSH